MMMKIEKIEINKHFYNKDLMNFYPVITKEKVPNWNKGMKTSSNKYNIVLIKFMIGTFSFFMGLGYFASTLISGTDW